MTKKSCYTSQLAIRDFKSLQAAQQVTRQVLTHQACSALEWVQLLCNLQTLHGALTRRCLVSQQSLQQSPLELESDLLEQLGQAATVAELHLDVEVASLLPGSVLPDYVFVSWQSCHCHDFMHAPAEGFHTLQKVLCSDNSLVMRPTVDALWSGLEAMYQAVLGLPGGCMCLWFHGVADTCQVTCQSLKHVTI